MTRLLVVVLALLAFAPGAQAARVALVMGNGAYAQGNTLTNPPVDAEAVAAFLTTAGFSVTTVVDAPGAGMAEALTDMPRPARPMITPGLALKITNCTELMLRPISIREMLAVLRLSS